MAGVNNSLSKKLVCIAVAVAAIFLITSPAYGVDDGNVGGVPANPREDNPRSKSIFVHEMNGGETVDDAVLVRNGTNKEKTIQIYAVDAQNSSGGAFACEQKADKAQEAGSWIKISEPQIVLASGTEKAVGFTIATPENAGLGEHNACIAIQAVEPATKSGVNGVELSFRSAIRVAITVKGGSKKSLAITSLNISNKGKVLVVNETLKNDGNVSLDAKLDTRLKSIYGRTIQKKGGEFPVLAGNESEFNFEFDAPTWGGFYFVEASAEYVNDPDVALGEKGGSTKVVSKSELVFVAPKPIVSVAYGAAALAIGIGAVSFIKKNRLMKFAKKNGFKYKVQSGDTVQDLAKTHNISWKDIVKVNKLSKPYALEVGKEIIIPSNSPTATPSDSSTSSTGK